MLHKTVIVLAITAALTGGLTADALARGGGGGGGGGHMGGGFGGGGRGGFVRNPTISWDHRPRRCRPLKTGFRPRSPHPRRHPSSTGRCHSQRSGA